MDQFVTVTQAVKTSGLSRHTLYRRIKEGSLPTYEHDRNRRVVLVKLADLAALATPRRRPAPVAREAGR